MPHTLAPGTALTVQDVADLIDHALLKPELTPAEVEAACRELAQDRIWSVCVRPSDVRLALAAVDGSPTRVCTVIGFPHGTTSTAAKLAESSQKMGAAMYAAGEAEQAASGAGDAGQGDSDDDVVDAEIVDEDQAEDR